MGYHHWRWHPSWQSGTCRLPEQHQWFGTSNPQTPHTNLEHELCACPHIGGIRDAEDGVIGDARILDAVAGCAAKVVVRSMPDRALLDLAHKRPSAVGSIVVARQCCNEQSRVSMANSEYSQLKRTANLVVAHVHVGSTVLQQVKQLCIVRCITEESFAIPAKQGNTTVHEPTTGSAYSASLG